MEETLGIDVRAVNEGGFEYENWITRLHLICYDNGTNYSINIIFSLALNLGMATGSLFMIVYADIYGRKTMIVTAVGLQICTLLALVIAVDYMESLYLTLILMFLNGAWTATIWSVLFVYVFEFTTGENQKTWTIQVNITTGIVTAIISLEWKFFLDVEWIIFLYLVVLAPSLLYFIFKGIESPYFLLSTRRYDKFY